MKKCNLLECCPRCIPADPFPGLSKDLRCDSTSAVELASVYREVVGSLNYLVTCTRPDIAYAVNQVSQFSNSPTGAH